MTSSTPSILFFIYFSIFLPLFNIRKICETDTPISRWLLYVFCMNAISIPLIMCSYFPFRYEILLMLAALLCYDDARGAHRFFVGFVLPRMDRVKAIFEIVQEDAPTLETECRD